LCLAVPPRLAEGPAEAVGEGARHVEDLYQRLEAGHPLRLQALRGLKELRALEALARLRVN